MQCNAEQSIRIYSLCKHIQCMDQKNNRVQDTLVEDYMTLTTVTLNFKKSVLDIAKKMLAENISSIAITDDEGEIIGILTERDIIKIIANELPPGVISAMSLMSFPPVKVKKKTPIWLSILSKNLKLENFHLLKHGRYSFDWHCRKMNNL